MLAGKKFAALFTRISKSPKFFRNLHEQFANLIHLSQIGGKRYRAPPQLLDFRNRFLRLSVRIAVVDHQIRAFRRQPQRYRSAKPLR